MIGTPERGAVIQRTRELVKYARQHGFRPDELIQINLGREAEFESFLR